VIDLSRYDPFSKEAIGDPYSHHRALRDQAPCHFVESRNLYVVSRFDDVVAVCRNHAVFSSTGGVGFDWNPRPMMPMYDPPEHTRMRRMVAKHFTPLAVARFESKVETIVEELLAPALERGDTDFVNDIALPLSLGTIASLLGVPKDLHGDFRRWSQGVVDDLAGGLPPAEAARVEALRRDFIAFLKDLTKQRAASAGSGDVVSLLCAAQEDEKLSPKEVLAFCVLLLVAGFETTVNAIANAALALMDHQEQHDKLYADPSLVESFVEEAIRYDGPVQSFFRNTLVDHELHGVRIPSGVKVMVLFGSANRDERHYREPDTFRIERNPTDHVGFGVGVHYCLGAPLARMQMTALTRALIARKRRLVPNGPVARTGSVLFRGAKHLPVRLEHQ